MKTLVSSTFSNRWRIPQGRALVMATVAAIMALTVQAADIEWQGGTASYTNAADWVGGVVPGANDNAINDNGTNNVVQVNFGDPDWTVSQIRAGSGTGDGAFEQNGQTVTLGGTNYNGSVVSVYTTPFRLGIVASDTGVYTMNDGTLNYGTGGLNVGELGTGVLNINGGAINGSGNYAVNLGTLATPTAVTATFAGLSQGDYTWFEQGFYTPNASLGLPAPGTTIASIMQGDHSYTLASSYTANDAVMVSANVTNATITPAAPISGCSGLSFLGSAGSGPVVVNYAVHHADSTTETGSISVPDWFGSSGIDTNLEVMAVGGRVNALGVDIQTPASAHGLTGNAPYIFSLDIAVTNTGSAVTSIDLSYVSGGVACLLGISSSTGGAYNPVAMSGYNEDMIVEAGAQVYVAGSITDVVNQTGGAVNVTGGGQWFVGNVGKGIYNLSGGSVDVHNYIALGRSSGNGTVNMTGGTLNQDGGGNLLVGTGYNNNGNAAVGVLNQSAGTINSLGQFLCPENSPSTGTYDLSGSGVLNVSNWFVIGRQGGSGVMNISDNAVINKTANGDFIVCDGDNETGTVNMSGGTFNVLNGWFRVGNGNNAQATFVQSNATVSVANGQFLVPDHGDASTLGTYTISGNSTLTVNNWLAVGRNSGPGILNLNSGSITRTVSADGGSHFDVGASAAGTFNMNGGTVTNTASDFWLGENGTAIWNMNGGSAILGQLVFAVNGGGSGNLHLNGGLIRTTGISVGAGGAGMDFNGGTLQAGANNANFMSGLIFAGVSSGGAVIDSQGYDITIAQELDDNGGGGLTKLGSGMLTLSGPNTYSGPTAVSNGTLVVQTPSSANGDYTVADGAGFGVTAASLNAQLTMASLTAGSLTGVALDFDLGSFGNPSSAPMNVSGTFTVNGTVTVNIADGFPQVGQFPLIQFGSLAGSGGFVIGSLPPSVVANIVTNGNTIALNISSVDLPRWEGLAGGTWDLSGSTNWVNSGTGLPASYSDGDLVSFDDNALGTTTVDVTTTVNPGGVTVNNSSKNYTFTGTGAISGTTTLNKQGTGTLTIANNNNYTGPTIISGGTVAVTNLADGGSPSPIGASSASSGNLVLSGGTLAYSGPAVSINRGYSVQATNSAIDTESNLTLTGVAAATTYGGFNKTGTAQLTYKTVGANVLSGSASAGYIVQSGTVVFDGSNGSQSNSVQGTRLGVDDPAGNATVVLTNTTVNLSGNLDLGNIAYTMGSMVVNSNSTLNIGSWFIFGDGGSSGGGGNAGGTFTLNGGTVNAPSGWLLMGGNIGAMSTMNINGGVLNNAGGNFDIADGGWNTAGVRTGIVNQVGGVINNSGETWIGQSTDGHGFYNLHGGTINASNWFVVGRNGSVGTMIMDGGIINKSANGDFLVGDGGGTIANMYMTNATINISSGNFTIGHAGATGTMNQNGGTINMTTGEYWVGENGFATNNISGAAVINVPSYVTVARGASTAVVNMSSGTFTQTGSNPFYIGIFGGGHAIWNQSGGALSVSAVMHVGDGNADLGELNLSGGSVNLNNELWIGQGAGATGVVTVAGSGVFTNVSWLAVGREGGTGTLNIDGGTFVRTGPGGGPGGPNVSIAHGGGPGTVNVNSGSIDVSAGDTWIGEDSNTGIWNMNGGTAKLSLVQLAHSASANGILNLNGGSFTATEVSTGDTSSTNRTLNFNGGTLVAGADNTTNFIHDLSAANVLTNGAIIDTASYSVAVNQALLGGTNDGGLTKNGAGTLYLNGVNTYTNVTQVNAGALGGMGTIMGPVTVASGAELAPGTESIGTLTINNTLSLASGSSTRVKISMNGGVTNDVVAGLTGVAYDGTLVVTNVGGTPLVAGTQFHLFNSVNPGSGNFTAVTILPAGAGTFDPSTGILTITGTGIVTFNPPVVSGNNLILTGDGGAAPGSGYTLLTTTNVAAPRANWTTNTTGTLDSSGMFSNSIPISVSEPTRFFDVRVP